MVGRGLRQQRNRLARRTVRKGRSSELKFHRPVVWIVGASRGIGREIAKQFASIGCRVCLSARSKNELGSAVDEISTLGGIASAFPCDITSPSSISASIRDIRK